MHTSLGGGGGATGALAPPLPSTTGPEIHFLLINDLKPIELIVFFNCNSLIVY